MAKRLFAALAVLCVLALGLSLWYFLRPTPPQPESQPLYTLVDEGGRLALYGPQGAEGGDPIRVYEIYTRLLPETDLERLAQGLPVYTELELQKRLEDYGL